MGVRGHRRVLLLGPTGVDKATAANRLRAFAEESLGQSFRYVDFENEYLKPELPPPANWINFLASDARYQATFWQKAWTSLAGSLKDGETTILALHATYVSGALGLRCSLNIPAICGDFRPTLIISMIDDVQAMWRRTEARAGGQTAKGRPSLEQLISARRAEQILGDVILSHSSGHVRHILCASGNCIDALSNLIFFDADVTYLSFPISAPREIASNGDHSFIDLINDAHKLAASEMKRNHRRAFISPLSIDELPLLARLRSLDEPDEPSLLPSSSLDMSHVAFDCATDRWPVDMLWGNPALPIVPSLAGRTEYSKAELSAASGMIQTDVGWRDRRLVLQSHSLAIVCPKPPNAPRITRGVEEEISTAIAQGIPCHYWQKQEWDEGNFLGSRFPEAGSMGLGQTQAMMQRQTSLQNLILASP